MLRRTAQLSVGVFLAFCPVLLSGQAAQPQYYVFCAAQAPPAAPGVVATVYYSGILQGTAANLASFRTDFATFLMQKYAYKGAAACAPANSMANAQTAMNNQITAFRNAKRNVVETGWTEGGAGGILGGGGSNPLSSISNPLGSILGGGQSNTAAPTNQNKSTTTGGQTGQAPAGGAQGQATGRGGAGGAGGGNGGGNQSTFNNVFGQIFGNGGGGGNGGGAKTGQAQPNANAKPGQGGPGATGGAAGGANGGGGNGGGGGNQSPFAQVSSVIFGNRGGGNGGGGNNGGGNGGGRGGQPGQPGQPGPANGVVENNNAPGQPGAPGGRGGQGGQPAQQESGVLGSAQFGTTKLDIYGCARQDLQVACVTELTNQNPKDTLVKSADIWKDAFIVDDRGDRHTRTNAFFLNVDGEQRQQLDISNGKTAKFVLMFDQVPAKVEKVTLRSQTGGLDVEEMGLLAPDGSAPGTTTAAAPAAQH